MTPTCVAPRHVDAPRDFFYFIFLRTSSARAARLFFFFPCSADHERDWLSSCKVVFFGLATNALNVRNNNNNNCRESAGIGLVNLEVVLNECCLGRSPWTN